MVRNIMEYVSNMVMETLFVIAGDDEYDAPIFV